MRDIAAKMTNQEIVHSGYLLIADISGYTEFLTGSELDHAQAIMQALLGSLVGAIAEPLRLAKVEGDAVFCYAPTKLVVRPQTVLDVADDLYVRFTAALEHTIRNTTCPCRACRHAAELGLKFVLHHGQYIEHVIAGNNELTGTAVIVVHRLMKNHIREKTGIEAYLFVTDSAAAMLPQVAGVRHEEMVEGVGVVPGYVRDMAPIWQRHRETDRRWVKPDALLLFPATSVDLPISLPEAWSYLLDAGQRMRWVEGMTGMTVSGAMQQGTALHCAHGAEIRDFEIVDWRPCESVSFDRHLGHRSTVRLTYDLEATPLGTRLDARVALVDPGSLFGRFLVMRGKAKTQASVGRSLSTLSSVVANDVRDRQQVR
jgi:Protein of unknown function (DUF2652)